MSGIVVLLFFTELDQTDNKRQSNKANPATGREVIDATGKSSKHRGTCNGLSKALLCHDIILLYANYYTVSHVYLEIELNR